MTTAADYGRFLAYVLRVDDERWQPLWRIDDELAWSAGWGIELGPPLHGWQWGHNDDASSFVIGCPSTGDGVVILTDNPNGRPYYRSVVERVLPGDHASPPRRAQPDLARTLHLTAGHHLRTPDERHSAAHPRAVCATMPARVAC